VSRAALLAAALLVGGAAAAEPPPSFVRTDDSSEWIARSLRVQRYPRRVLLVDAAPGARPRTVRVPWRALGGGPGLVDELAVDAVYATIQDAVDHARGGDLVSVSPGRYAGFRVGPTPETGDERFLVIRALGDPGAVVVDRGCDADRNWMVMVQAAHHVVIWGFRIAGTAEPGQPNPPGPRAGIFLDGDFGNSGRLAHHIAIVGNFVHNQARWGLHSTDTHTVLIEDNLFARSGAEHAAYVSDGSDDYVIRRNVFFGSFASGLQINLDPEASLEETVKHPAMRDLLPMQPTAEWAARVVQRATAVFGEHGFPDGRGVNFIVEDNVMQGNGRRGGGALNLAGLQASLIQNNLIYGNYAHGIAEWDNANPFDARRVATPPRTPAEARDPERLPRWGCAANRIRNNTVVMASRGRAALSLIHGSFGNRVSGNLLVNDADAALEVDAASLLHLDARANVVGSVRIVGDATPRGLVDALAHATEGVTRRRLAGEVVADSDEPWVILDGSWWSVNPQRPDLRPRPGSSLLVGVGAALH
jgi:hypothetical protein